MFRFTLILFTTLNLQALELSNSYSIIFSSNLLNIEHNNLQNDFLVDQINLSNNSYVKEYTDFTPSGYTKGGWKRSTNWSSRFTRTARQGDGVKIAIFDTAINCAHINLKSNANRNCNFYAYNADGVWNTEEGWDHGSHAAGVAAGTRGYGVAPNADIVGYAVFDDNGWYVTNAQFLAMADDAKEKGTSVWNWSFGRTDGAGDPVPTDLLEMAAIRKVTGSALVVKAAGNDGKQFTNYQYNGVNRGVLSSYLKNFMWVGALNQDETGIAFFSNKPGEACFAGRRENRCTNRNKYKYYWIVAPGYVFTTDGDGRGGERTQGTSFSAPIVAGAAALIKSKWGHLTPKQIRDILLRTATDMGARGVDPIYGRGKLNITKALKPINGRVGGVRVNRNNARVFNRTYGLGDFKNNPVVIDEYNRDFQGQHLNFYSSSGEQYIYELNTNNNPVAIGLLVDESNENNFFKVNSIQYGSLYFNNEINPSSSFLDFNEDSSPLDLIPHTQQSMNTGNSLFSISNNKTSVFFSNPSGSNNFYNPTETIGVLQNFEVADNLTLKNYISLNHENGFRGLSSQEGFGFDTFNDSILINSGFQFKKNNNIFELSLERLQTSNSYNHEIISWSHLSTNQLMLSYAKEIGDNSTFQLKANSSLVAEGDMRSSISGFQKTSDFFYEKPSIAINYKTKITEQSSLEITGSSLYTGSLEVGYQILF